MVINHIRRRLLRDQSVSTNGSVGAYRKRIYKANNEHL